MKLTWHPWATVSQGSAAPGSAVSALRYGNVIALFIADPNGGVYTAAGNPVAGWGPWTSVSQGRTAPRGTVSAVPYGTRFALFLADPNGGIYTVAGTPNTGWGPWSSVSEGRAAPGAPVTAVPFGERIALFIADPNGGIYTTAGTPDGGWGPWSSVSDGRTVPGSLVTAVQRQGQPIRFELFITDPNGGIYTVSGNPDSGWGPWSQVTNELIAPGSPVNAIPLGSEVALFMTNAAGRVYTSIGSPERPWVIWAWPSQGAAPPHSLVTAVQTSWLANSSTYTLVLTDPNGGVYASVGEIYNAQAGWGPWSSVSDGRAVPGSPVAAVAFGNSLVVFVTDPNGGIYTTSSRFDIPARPTNLSETSVSADAIGVAWDDNASDADGFRVTFSGARSGQANHDGNISVGSTARAATLSNLLSGYSYTIRVVAFNAAGNSPSSNAIVVTIPIAPQLITVTLTLRPEGAFEASYPPGFGTVPAGHLLQIAVPPSPQVKALDFIKFNKPVDCSVPDNIVRIAGGNHTTAAQLAAILGANPTYSTNSPMLFRACVETPDAYVPDSVLIQITIIADIG